MDLFEKFPAEGDIEFDQLCQAVPAEPALLGLTCVPFSSVKVETELKNSTGPSNAYGNVVSGSN